MLSNPNVIDARLAPFRAGRVWSWTFGASASSIDQLLPLVIVPAARWAIITSLELSPNSYGRFIVRDHNFDFNLEIDGIARLYRQLTSRETGLSEQPLITPTLNILNTLDPPLLLTPGQTLNGRVIGTWNGASIENGLGVIIGQVSGFYSQSDLSALGFTPTSNDIAFTVP